MIALRNGVRRGLGRNSASHGASVRHRAGKNGAALCERLRRQDFRDNRRAVGRVYVVSASAGAGRAARQMKCHAALDVGCGNGIAGKVDEDGTAVDNFVLILIRHLTQPRFQYKRCCHR